MPRISGDGSGGGAKNEKTSGLGGWFGGAARVMTGSGGGGYVILGGTRYGIRLSQESMAPETTPEDSPDAPNQLNNRESTSRECLTDSTKKKQLGKELSSSVGDCCCIGPRSKLPLPRLPLSPCSRIAKGTEKIGTGNTANTAANATKINCEEAETYEDDDDEEEEEENEEEEEEEEEREKQSIQPPTRFELTRLPPNSNANNNCGGLQMGSYSTQPQSSTASSSIHTTNTTTITNTANSVFSTSSFNPIAHNTVSVPRQIAQWTKHHTLKLQEPAITAVDRLHRFRWSGGGGGAAGGRGGKKSSSGPRSEKAERLRELTEKLKGPAPVPPPRRPSRTHTSSSPPPGGSHHHQQNFGQSDNGKPSIRSNTYSEGSSGSSNNTVENSNKKIVRSESVGDECNDNNKKTIDNNGNRQKYNKINDNDNYKINDLSLSRKTSRSINDNFNRHSDDIEEIKKTSNDRYSEPKHYRQCSDSLIDSNKYVNDNCRINESSNICINDSEARDALSRLEPRGSLLAFQRTGAPCRSASFGQVDFNQGNRHKTQPISSTNHNEISDVRASTLPRRRGNNSSSPIISSPQKSPDRQSPCASTPSVDSAVGSAEGLGVHQLRQLEKLRPRSDGSDSLATSSALTSPEPPVPLDNQEVRVNITQPECTGNDHGVMTEQMQQECGNVEENEAKVNQIEPHEVIITPPPDEPRLSQASETSEAPSETQSEASSPSGKVRRYRGDTSKRRKGVYITQWPEPSENERNKLAAQSSEEKEDQPATLSDLSDCEGHTPRRYSKRPLRGPYGQMLEAEMAKPRSTDIALEDNIRQRRKISPNLSYTPGINSNSEPPTPGHHRTTSSPSKLEGLPGPSPELLAELLRGSSERVSRSPVHRNDTRTHVVVELYDTEKSYVEALQILVNKYLHNLKNSENAGLVDAAVVDEIFYQVPAILSHHEIFLDELRKRLETWETRQTIGDVFLDVFTKPAVLETYTLFLDNWKSAKKAIKTTCQTKPAFARFLETMEREHKGKLGLDQLLIKPVQKIPRYELLIQRLLKHTDKTHPDHELLTAAQREVHELVVKINCTERESLEWEQQQTTLREVQSLVEGLAGIVTNDRAFIRHDLVTIASNQGTRKERALFLFSDLLVITSIKRRSGTIRKPSTSSCPNSLVGLLEANKYKLLMRIPLDDLEVMKAKDENLRRMAREVDHLREDCATLSQLQELTGTLHGPRHQLEDLIKELLNQTQRQLAERNAAHSQLACLELTLNTQSGIENISIMFTKPDKRASWEESFNEAKQKLALSADRRPCPEFVGPLPIRKTRAGLQFTCAAPTIENGQGLRDVWVCNSDGYVGQVCVLSLTPEPPQVTSCNGVCNARILCVSGIPAGPSNSNMCTLNKKKFSISKSGISISVQDADVSGGNIQLDSSSSSEDSDSDDIPCADTAGGSLCGDFSSIDGTIEEDMNQPTMWLGTEDGCIHVYNCNDNIRIKKNKVKIQHGSSVHCIVYVDNKVFVALANGDITIYSRDHCGWNTSEPAIVSVGTSTMPVTKMVHVSGKLWCSCHNTVKVLNIENLEIEQTLNVSGDNTRPVSCMATSGGVGVWISLHNSAVLRLFHANTYECLADVNIAPAVTKMLSSCDDIIRQHKAACLRVTALLACNDLLWIGTSAGVLLTVPIPHMKPSTQRLSQPPLVTGIPHGHTGHVRFLTCVEIPSSAKPDPHPKVNLYTMKNAKTAQNNIERTKLLVISGGDGYEDFRGPQASAELQAGREDSTNHLLLWKV